MLQEAVRKQRAWNARGRGRKQRFAEKRGLGSGSLKQLTARGIP